MNECNGKRCLSKNEALKIKQSSYKKRSRKVRVYLCDWCFEYHLTTTNESLKNNNLKRSAVHDE